MGVPGNANPLLLRTVTAAATGISRSLRFNSADSAYLSRTPASAGNRKTWTWSGWVKRTKIGSGINGSFFRAAASGQIWFKAGFQDDTISVSVVAGGAEGPKTSAVFRDTSAWYHIVIAFDTTQATAANRQKLYVNGVQVSFTTDLVWPNQNQDYQVNNTVIHYISDPAGGEYFDGYLADVWFVDGSALTPSDFAETDATTGQWNPKAYTGSYGTNGFHLEFADNSAATATTLGKDTSGNGNNWTPNNLSVTAGAGNDSLIDVPTNGAETDTGVGEQVRGNYCTLNPLDNGGLTLSNGNLQFNRAANAWLSCRSTIAVTSGKWYWEVSLTTGTQCMVGIAKAEAALNSYFAISSTGWGYNAADGYKYNADTPIAYGNTWTAGDTIGIAFDANTGELKFYKNGTVQNSGTAAYTGLTSGPYFATIGLYGTATAHINFGQRAFAYTAPSGFKALCTANLPAPSVTKPSTVMDVKLYTGNGGTQTISGLNFSPDWIWFKQRNTTRENHLYDSVRGVQKALYTDLTNAEATDTDALSSFNSDGWTMGADGGSNQNNGTYVAWCWDAGSSTVTNTQGSITSSVRANPSSGFSIVTFNSGPNNGVNQTIGHGCGGVPQLIIIKSRTGNATWTVYHASATSINQFLALDATNAVGTASNIWGGAAPTTTVFGFRSSQNQPQNTDCVAYVWAPVTGYSSMGLIQANGSTDGPFVYTGHRSRFILIKGTTRVSNWVVIDTARNTYNVIDFYLQPNTSGSEATASSTSGPYIDVLSNGFKIRSNGGDVNNSASDQYLYVSFAENPFQYARAR